MGNNTTPVLTLLERLQHFEKHELENDDEYGAEVLHHAITRIQSLEEERDALGEQYFDEQAANAALRAEVERLTATVERYRYTRVDTLFISVNELNHENVALRAEVERLKVEDEQRFDKWRAVEVENERLRDALKPLVRERNKIKGYLPFRYWLQEGTVKYECLLTKADRDAATEGSDG